MEKFGKYKKGHKELWGRVIRAEDHVSDLEKNNLSNEAHMHQLDASVEHIEAHMKNEPDALRKEMENKLSRYSQDVTSLREALSNALDMVNKIYKGDRVSKRSKSGKVDKKIRGNRVQARREAKAKALNNIMAQK